ncbi:MAG: F0F1 ATP synthase subunit A [Candidatus Omnitrophica bacterium]|nr:F0F1 ATP synthase subunit A [Candidatus Omnitrophota bacterium]MBI5024589.1 F0F1 ATP synthase subunit A [Candidatus Omnitrophota bacterium]
MSAPFDLGEYILRHTQDSRQWHLPFLPPVQLPLFLSLHGLMLIIAASFLIALFCLIYDKKTRVPRRFTNLLELMIIFIRDEIAVKNLGEEDGRRMTPFLCTLFFFILTLNLMGMIPIFSTATANPNVTAALAFFTLCFMVFGTLYKSGFKGLQKALVPAGVPKVILIILVPVEFFGIFIKTGALTIRLFANMLAGHMVILSMLGLVLLLGLVALPSILLAVSIGILETFIAFLQAYIFTLLTAVFIGQMYHPEH